MTAETRADGAPPHLAEVLADVVPSRGSGTVPLVGFSGGAGSIEALQVFFSAMPPQSGLAFAVLLHLPAEEQRDLASVLQRSTRMRVADVQGRLDVQPGTIYVIPPGRTLSKQAGDLVVVDASAQRKDRSEVDVFFRTLADVHGPHAAAVVLSGEHGDGAVGIKRVKECGGLTIAQDPDKAAHRGMPREAISTTMVDWVLPVEDMPARLLGYFRMEQAVHLPPEDATGEAPSPGSRDEADLQDVLAFLHTRTGRDFSSYKRPTVLRRIRRRMQVNGVDNLASYLNCLRMRPGEAGALLQDLLISVTNFFRDANCFDALATHIPALFEGKGPQDVVRVWTVPCATGEEAYSVAMLLAEHARTLQAPPQFQVFATDLDPEAVQVAREGIYPSAIATDLSEDRLRHFFVKEHRGYRVRRELRETVLFAVHDVLRDSPFSRLDLITCRNLLIYLTREAQEKVLATLHFSLVPHGKLFLGASESIDEGSPLFTALDKQHRIFRHRSTARRHPVVPRGHASLAASLEAARPQRDAPRVLAAEIEGLRSAVPARAADRQSMPSSRWGEMHLHLLERLSPPSVLVDADHDIVHLSESAGRFLQFSGGEPTRSLLLSLPPNVRLQVRAALLQAAHERQEVVMADADIPMAGGEKLAALRIVPMQEGAETLLLVVFDVHDPQDGAQRARRLQADPMAHHLDAEIDRMKLQLRETVEQYEASTEELKASNEELQAMNEELQASTEELETSREELQSINEELATVNQELKSKVEQLSHSNSDLQNLMDATQLATVFLDRELRIMRYTPASTELFHLISSDVGRPLTDLASRLDYPDMAQDARLVLERLAPVEREVGRGDGNWYFARVVPYRTSDDRIAGVIFTFIDVTERKRGEEVRRWLSSVVSASPDGIISFALDQTVLSWNAGAQRLLGYTPQEAIGQPLSTLTKDGADVHAQVLGQIAAGEIAENTETAWKRNDGTRVRVAITASPIRDEDGRVIAGTAVVRDVTAAHEAAKTLRERDAKLRLIFENAVEYAIFAQDLERRITSWNVGAERLLGFTEEEAIGQLADIIFVPEDRATDQPAKEARTAIEHERAADERIHLRKDGSRFRGSGIMMLMRDASGEPIGLVKILRDLSRPPPDPRG